MPDLLARGVLLRALLLCSVIDCFAWAADDAAVKWIRENAIPLRTVEAGNGFADMQPLKKIVGDARIVALGEATHGTREFFQLKHRMVEFLATEMGFTIFSIEANMPEAYRLNDYVLNGTGDPKALLKGMYFWTWNTEEVLAMIEWMREFNRSGRGRIEFTGFDMQTPTVAMDIVRRYVRRSDPAYADTLKDVWQQVPNARPASSGVATSKFPFSIAAGKTVTFSGFIRTRDVTRGYAGLWWRADGEKSGRQSDVLAFDNMQDRGARGTTPWTRYQITLQIPPNTRNIDFGVLHPGDGTAWFDSLQVAINGTTYTDTSTFDLDFESPTPRGFSASHNLAIDTGVAHSGKQSLRSSFTGPAKTGASRVVAIACLTVVEHLQARRAALAGDPAALKELDWAVQNAHVVAQSVQMHAGRPTRDQSMADNVRWIADHNPGAKIVLWAHNGHIGYGVSPMGGYLKKMFGPQVVNFGFAFNQGSFQAIESGKGLHDFTVGPAPENSLDRALASTDLPLLALDLRRLPKESPVAEWFRAARPTRSIGAMFSTGDADRYLRQASAPAMYDALLFVEKTTAARPVR